MIFPCYLLLSSTFPCQDIAVSCPLAEFFLGVQDVLVTSPLAKSIHDKTSLSPGSKGLIAQEKKNLQNCMKGEIRWDEIYIMIGPLLAEYL